MIPIRAPQQRNELTRMHRCRTMPRERSYALFRKSFDRSLNRCPVAPSAREAHALNAVSSVLIVKFGRTPAAISRAVRATRVLEERVIGMSKVILSLAGRSGSRDTDDGVRAADPHHPYRSLIRAGTNVSFSSCAHADYPPATKVRRLRRLKFPP